jgi:dTMP kinase
MAVTRGRFITLEGGEGAGKSTQLGRLAAVLSGQGLDVVTTREPGGTEGAEAIRRLLLEGGADRWNAPSEALLFAAARGDHVAKLIEPALARGAWVLCDRFVDSTRAYQGGGGGMADADVLTLHRIGSGGLMPDRTFLLHIAADEAARRLAARDGDRTDRMGAKPADYHARLAARFAELAAAAPDRWRAIDASGDPAAVTEAMVMALADLLP